MVVSRERLVDLVRTAFLVPWYVSFHHTPFVLTCMNVTWRKDLNVMCAFSFRELVVFLVREDALDLLAQL